MVTAQTPAAQWLWNAPFNRFEQRTSDGRLLAVKVGQGSVTSDLPTGIPQHSLDTGTMAAMQAVGRGDQQADQRAITLVAALNGDARAGEVTGTATTDASGQMQGYGDSVAQIQAGNHRNDVVLANIKDAHTLDAAENALRLKMAQAGMDPSIFFHQYAQPAPAGTGDAGAQAAAFGRVSPAYDAAYADQLRNAAQFAVEARAQQLQHISDAFDANQAGAKTLQDRAQLRQGTEDNAGELRYRYQQMQQTTDPRERAAAQARYDEMAHQASVKARDAERATAAIDQQSNPALYQQRQTELARASLTPDQLAAMGPDQYDPVALSYRVPPVPRPYAGGGQVLPAFAGGGTFMSPADDQAERDRISAYNAQGDATAQQALATKTANDQAAAQRAKEQADAEAGQHELAAKQAQDLARQQIEQIRAELAAKRAQHDRDVATMDNEKRLAEQQHVNERDQLGRQIAVLTARKAGRGLVSTGGATYAG